MDSQYKIGIPEMDEQHAKLFELASKARLAGADDFAMNGVVLELINYANAHLDSEEAFLKSRGLDDFLKDHSKKHLLFRHQAMDFYDRFREAADVETKAELLQQIVSFCENWLKQHINVEDRAYAKLLSAQK